MPHRNLIKTLYTATIGSRIVFRCQPSLAMTQGGSVSSSQMTGGADDSDNTDVMPFIVGHDKRKKCFYINIEKDGKRQKESAILEYDWIRPGFVDLYHTEVPQPYRGQGIAKILAKAALEYFVAENAKMRLTCTYLHKYVRETRLPRVWDHVCWED